MKSALVWGADLYKGFKIPKDSNLTNINDILPFQMLKEEEKTIDWIHAIADYYETAGWNNVEKKAYGIQRNFWLRNAQLNPSDYIINPTINEYYQAINVIIPRGQESPLEQFYPLIPNIVDVLRGEFLKRDTEWTVDVTDQYSKSLILEAKEEEFNGALEQFAMQQKQIELYKMGLIPQEGNEEINQQFEQAMQQFQQNLQQIELKYKNFRTTGAKWAEKMLRRQDKRYNLHEIEPDAFESGLICDREFWHLDMMENGYRVELINPKWCDYHKSPNTKYVSEGDYFLWFDFLSAADIVNKFGRRMEEGDILKMKEIYMQTANLLIPDHRKHLGEHGNSAYYDPSKDWHDATALDPKMNDAMLGKELAYSFTRNPNFDHNMDVDILNPVWGRRVTGHPQMFRVMRLYWRSFKRVGWITKMDRSGQIEYQGWVDEHYKVTVEPKYDNSVIKTKSKDNLIYGEHIDWTWTYEWRHLIKISPNQKHTFWLNSNNYEPIIIDGGPIPFQFKSVGNPYDALPPIEGCEFSYINSSPFSLVDRLRPMQILYNIAWNKVPKKFLDDFGIKVAVHRANISSNPAIAQIDGQDMVSTYEDTLRESPIIDYSVSPEVLRTMGQPPVPAVLNLSTAQEAILYMNIAAQIKMEAGEVVGITRQRLGQQKASETAYGIEQGIVYSETQTEKYFENHFNLMKRVRQRMLDADQYYSTLVPDAQDTYLDDAEERIWINTSRMEGLMADYEVDLKMRASMRSTMQKLEGFLFQENTLDFAPEDKIEMILTKSLPEMWEAIRRARASSEAKIQEQRQHELAMEEEKRKTILAQLEMEQQHEDYQKDLDRQNNLDVAEVRALGGIQTDVNANAVPDAAENLVKIKGMELKQQEIKDKKDIESQKNIDNMILQREKNALDLEREKIKADAAKYVAKINKNPK